ncbi:Bug family tripartite tricarboxylate transporter substrate binding protein [Variovorax fucosicus]|uniref:Bug family tripartite tricarboxylate transporter substrate binding protein n=1 Tax=Variovorax fucosicus TaxID=3053517 RepID=UPI0025766119|nr:tripartite tricarboxylate transporter substrate binding protein [Variovorax sp. J22G47]MDM0058833.1 tripartite tricarboxylate transporter substrate binding protein [Variovorax sp. J22G47]
MPVRRRTFIQSCAAAVGTSAGHAISHTATDPWPAKPVKLIVPFPAGAGIDVGARNLGDQLQTVWARAQPVVVDNKPGGSTIIAMNSLLSSPRDGHTFAVTMNLPFLLPYLGQRLPFDPMAELVPVGAVSLEQLVLVASPKLGARSFSEWVDKVKSNSVGAEFGTFGQGSIAHILASQIAREKKIAFVTAHYRGVAPALQGVLTGEIGTTLGNMGALQPFIASGKVIPLALTGAKRSRYFPDLPTLKEVGIGGMESPAWIGVFAARGTPPGAIQKMSSDMRKALQAPELVQKMNGYYQEPGAMSVEEFQVLVKSDVENLGELIRTHGIRLE